MKFLGVKMSMKIHNTLTATSTVVAFIVFTLPVAQATTLLLTGSPGYDQEAATGYRDGSIPLLPGSPVNNSGTAVGMSLHYDSGNYVGFRAVRWGADGSGATELGHLGLSVNGSTSSVAVAINEAGVAVGHSQKHTPGSSLDHRAIRWDSSGTVATELGHLGLSLRGDTNARAQDINGAGTAVGYASKYISGIQFGTRAVRWDGTVTTATELGTLGANSSGGALAIANAVNEVGTAVGYSQKYVSGTPLGDRAVRWDGAGTVATELGNLGVSATGYTQARAYAVNKTGTAVGISEKYINGVRVGESAVRWEGSGVEAAELIGLSDGASSFAYDVNEAGTAVGLSFKSVDGVFVGSRGVRWDGSSNTATELGNLGLSSDGTTSARALAVNDQGVAVGYAQKYINGELVGQRSVLWLPNTQAIDLNDLAVSPSTEVGSWLLTTASAISADGWVAGTGTFTPPEGTAYTRHWVTQVGLGGEWTDEFSGSLDGTWGRGKQWSTGTPATQAGHAEFNIDAEYTVSLDRNESTNSVLIGAGHIILDQKGFTLTAAAGVTIGSGARLESNGTLIGSVVVEGTMAPDVAVIEAVSVLNKGVIEIDRSSDHLADLHIKGDFVQSQQGELRFILAPADFTLTQPVDSLILVDGESRLSGRMVVDIGTYEPEGGERVRLLSAGVLTSKIAPRDFQLPPTRRYGPSSPGARDEYFIHPVLFVPAQSEPSLIFKLVQNNLVPKEPAIDLVFVKQAVKYNSGSSGIGIRGEVINEYFIPIAESNMIPGSTGSIALLNGGLDGIQLTTGSPAEAIITFETTEMYDAFSFDALFLGESGSNGLLTVYLDGFLIASLVQEVVPSGSAITLTDMLLLNDDELVALQGTHSLRIRIDPLTDAQASIQISNFRLIQTSTLNNVSIPEPTSAVLFALAMPFLIRQRRL